MTRVERSGRVGRVGDEGIDRVGHLVANLIEMVRIVNTSRSSVHAYHRKFVHGHLRKVTTIIRLMRDQASSRDHVSGHTIADKEQGVLGLADFRQIFYGPVCRCVSAIVAKDGFIFARLVERHTSISLGRDIDERRALNVLSEQVLIPSWCQ
jgi:hypothetical protein